MSDETRTEGQKVHENVVETVRYLRDGKVTPAQTREVRDAADRALSDQSVSRSIGRSFGS